MTAKFEQIDQRFDTMEISFDKKLTIFKHDIENKFDEKIDELAAMTARGFADTKKEMDQLNSRTTRLEKVVFATS
jgi:hypothetical protein